MGKIGVIVVTARERELDQGLCARPPDDHAERGLGVRKRCAVDVTEQLRLTQLEQRAHLHGARAVGQSLQQLVTQVHARNANCQRVSELPPCPKCKSTLTYEDGALLVCPECAYEWAPGAATAAESVEEGLVVKDAYGTVLTEGDTVTMIKDLKVKGATSTLKVGTKVKNIHLVEGDHNIDCKIDGFGAMALKSEFVKKS